MTGSEKLEAIGNNTLDSVRRVLRSFIRLQVTDAKAQDFIPRIARHAAIRFIDFNNMASGINHPESVSSGLYDGLQIVLAVYWHRFNVFYICQIITATIGM
jgi:hypothetical protein